MSSAENAKPLNVEAVESLARRRELIRESLRRAREIQREKDAAAKSLQSLAKDKSIMPQGAVPLVDQANARKRAKGEGSSTPRKKYGLDPDTLECPICAEPFSSPVFQCENGHTACSACCQKITNGCPSCSRPIGRIRCIAIEKVIESLHVECEHAHHGCKAMLKCSERAEHENNLCEFRPIQCPLHDRYGVENECTHKGPKAIIPMHLTYTHAVQIMECPGSNRSASVKVAPELDAVIFKFKDAWLLVSWCYQGARRGRVGEYCFYCGSFGASQEVEYRLTIKPDANINRESKRIYSMQDVAHASQPDGKYSYLVVLGREDAFEITLSLI